MYKRSISQWQTAAFKINKNGKTIQKLSPPLLAILPEGPQKKFLQNLIKNYLINFLDFILFLHREDWPECLSKIRWNKNEKNIYVRIS